MPTAPAPEKTKASQYVSAAPLAAAKVDAAAGVLRDVAIMSVGEAAGHGCDVDMVTLTKLFELTQGKTVKAFLNHSWNPSPDEVVGVFSGLYIDAAAGVLRAAQFQALGAFRTHNAKAYDTLFELAAIAPDSFGVSVSIYQDLAWKLSDGTEMLTDGWGNKPDKAVGERPFIRPTFIESADFVSTPAANTALFSRNSVDKQPDSSQSVICNETTSQQAALTHNTISTMKAVFAHFAANPKALPLIAKFAAEADEKATDADIIDKVEEALSAEEQAAIIAERDDLKAKLAAAEAKIAELDPEAKKAAELSTKVTELEGKVAQLSKRTGRYGIAPVNTGAPAKDAPPTITRAQFNAMSHKDRDAHFAAGGKLTD